MTRLIFLDTETTGLEAPQGHRIIEIACVEMIGRRFTENNFHYYLNPEREIDAAAQNIHGLSLEFLADKPRLPTSLTTFYAISMVVRLSSTTRLLMSGFLTRNSSGPGVHRSMDRT